MSTLFSALINAAMGEAAIAMPRPDARFAADGLQLDGIDWREARGENLPGDHPRPAPDVLDPPTIAPSVQASPQTSASPLLAVLPQDSLSAPRVAPSLWSPVAAPRHAIEEPTDTGSAAISPPRAALPQEAQIPARPAPVASADQPLLPLRDERPDELPRLIERVPGRNPSSPSTPTLTIGRIEVRAPPAVSLPPRQTSLVTTRSVALPRAAVRQSLDDYRAGRRR